MSESIERIAEVYWAVTDEGRGLVLRAGGSTDVGLATAIMCKCIVSDPTLSEAHAAAWALIKILTNGRGWPEGKPFEVYRGQKGGA